MNTKNKTISPKSKLGAETKRPAKQLKELEDAVRLLVAKSQPAPKPVLAELGGQADEHFYPRLAQKR
jgi:hypothetical protein